MVAVFSATSRVMQGLHALLQWQHIGMTNELLL
jgi:hypothetical protein